MLTTVTPALHPRGRLQTKLVQQYNWENARLQAEAAVEQIVQNGGTVYNVDCMAQERLTQTSQTCMVCITYHKGVGFINICFI